MKSIKLFVSPPPEALRGGETTPLAAPSGGVRRPRIKFALGWEAFGDVDFPGVGMELACGFSQASGQDVSPSLRGEQIRVMKLSH